MFALVLVVTGVAPAATRGTTEIRDLTWDRDDARGLTRVGRITLEMEGIEWRHAESEHFVYHFVRSWMAERTAGEAETFYAAVKRDLKVEEDRWEKKAHLFLFETVDSWRTFVEKFGVDRLRSEAISERSLVRLAAATSARRSTLSADFLKSV